MRTANLGPLSVSAQGLGCTGMSQSYGPGDDAESKATLLRALELGVTLFDTADVYGTTGAGGFGANETLLGQTLAGATSSCSPPSAGSRTSCPVGPCGSR